MSSYTGKFKHVLSSGEIIDLHVEDHNGYGMNISEADYNQRGIQPPVEELPTQHEYNGS